MRAVVDTNILVRAVLKPFGTVGPMVDRLEHAAYTPVYTGELLAELTEVLDRPRIRERSALTAAYRARTLALIAEEGERVTVERRIVACRDLKDEMVLEAAVTGHADVIVTGDQDLLVLSPFEGIPIVGPAEFLAILGDP